MKYARDRGKASANLRKHHVSFEEAATAFLDPGAWTFYDPDHSELQHRFITIGFSSHGRLLLVAHADQDDETMRIVTARRATAREKEE